MISDDFAIPANKSHFHLGLIKRKGERERERSINTKSIKFSNLGMKIKHHSRILEFHDKPAVSSRSTLCCGPHSTH